MFLLLSSRFCNLQHIHNKLTKKVPATTEPSCTADTQFLDHTSLITISPTALYSFKSVPTRVDLRTDNKVRCPDVLCRIMQIEAGACITRQEQVSGGPIPLHWSNELQRRFLEVNCNITPTIAAPRKPHSPFESRYLWGFWATATATARVSGRGAEVPTGASLDSVLYIGRSVPAR